MQNAATNSACECVLSLLGESCLLNHSVASIIKGDISNVHKRKMTPLPEGTAAVNPVANGSPH